MTNMTGELQSAQQQVAQLYAACQRLAAFDVRREDIERSRWRIHELRASIIHTREPTARRVLRVVCHSALLARLTFATVAETLGIAEPILGVCLSSLSCMTILAILALTGLSTAAALLIATFTLASCLIASLLLPPQVSTERAKAWLAQSVQWEISRQSLIANLRQLLDAEESRFSELNRAIDLKDQYENAKLYLELLVREQSNRRVELLNCGWRELRGIDFEAFLVRVFTALEYQVTTTKASGDQGVDLLARKGAVLLAIQAKGYSGSVGNSAVQEAYTGMRFYECNRCAVVTNSEFTSSAIELAAKTGCVLIDGRNIPLLIEGKLF